jgi:hypothetical protein
MPRRIGKSKNIGALGLFTLAAILLIVSILQVHAETTLVWKDTAYSNTGAPITTPILEMGKQYTINATSCFWYNASSGFQADAQYYTTSNNGWYWDNNLSLANGHSFLQINGTDANWGPFSNGETGHEYSITYSGQGSALTFQIVDWMDQNYTNNNCHIVISIYLENSPISTNSPNPTSNPSNSIPIYSTPKPTTNPTYTTTTPRVSPTTTPSNSASSTPSITTPQSSTPSQTTTPISPTTPSQLLTSQTTGQSPEPSNQNTTELSALIVLPLVIILASAAILLKRKKKSST